MVDPMGKAEHYLEQARRMRDLGLKESDMDRRDNLLALAENYHLLHDQLVELGRLHGSDP